MQLYSITGKLRMLYLEKIHMAYNEKLADTLREALAELPDVEEKKMFSGICFMVNGKMCICVSHDELMCRVGPDVQQEVIEKPGIRPMIMRGKTLTDYVYVSPELFKTKKELDYWVTKCLEYNKVAKASKPKKKKARR